MLGKSLFGHLKSDDPLLFARTQYSAPRLGTKGPVDIDGEAHLHGIGIVGGLGLHANGDLALFLNLGHPIHAFVSPCFDADLLDEILRHKVIPLQLQGDLDLPRTSQVVVDYGAEGDLVLLDEEAWGLQTDQQILACDDLGFTLPDHSSVPHGPDLDLPGRKIVRHGHFDLGIALLVGLDVGLPEGGVGEVASDPGIRQFLGIPYRFFIPRALFTQL